MNVLFFWEPVGGLTLDHPCNPYAGLLSNALAAHEVHLELGDYAFGLDWLKAQRESFDVLHLHWLHCFYRESTLAKSEARLQDFVDNLLAAREMGYRIVWTLHNLYPHERPFPSLDHEARLAVAQHAHEMIVHCSFAAERARELFERKGSVHVIPHGNFIDVFPNKIEQRQARENLGIPPDAFVYLFFGNARSYKGVEQLCQAFGAAGSSEDLLLLMMRRAVDPAYADRILAQTQADGRILVHTSPWFENADFQTYLNASNVAVFPFAEVLTSGSVITALSFGLPVIVPALGCLPELVGPSGGIVYDPGKPDGLPGALLKARSGAGLDPQAALKVARSLGWDSIATRTAALYAGSEDNSS